MSLRDILLGIREEHGRLTAPILLEEARNPGHPLHNRFEWDDGVAAEKYRLHQARQLIRTVKEVVVPAGEGEPFRVRTFHSIPSPAGRVYESAQQIAEDPFQRQLLLRQMERDWRSLKARFGRFDEFWRLVTGEAEAQAS